MNYNEFLDISTLNKQQLLAWSNQTLVDDPPGQIPSLPAPPMLMFDRITSVEHMDKKGRIIAQQDIDLDAWFFLCHFRNDPVQPGCLGVDAIWQLLGMYCAIRGGLGSGRALGCKEVEFFGQIRPFNKVVTYEVEIRKYSKVQGTSLVIGTGKVLVDGQHIYTINDAKVGIFEGIQYADYPSKSKNSIGGGYGD
ncbi:MAG: bifunctional 3-hydroxydecanoyl-ACP dehydratase/trans-2-decenoyl-ACP isomerase [Bacteriovoracaceae bacterium]|nr:bifunctional 3-hydroxydecanoyl-ACP dehydratase/trans-2-decenoyl-ACP isomerase [Bacteriovoracaceae bacterium]